MPDDELKKCKVVGVTTDVITIECDSEEDVDELVDKMDMEFYKDYPSFNSYEIHQLGETVEIKKIPIDYSEIIDGLWTLKVDPGKFQSMLS